MQIIIKTIFLISLLLFTLFILPKNNLTFACNDDIDCSADQECTGKTCTPVCDPNTGECYEECTTGQCTAKYHEPPGQKECWGCRNNNTFCARTQTPVDQNCPDPNNCDACQPGGGGPTSVPPTSAPGSPTPIPSTPTPTPVQWQPPTCTNGTFSGCRVLGQNQCSHYGNSAFSNWSSQLWNDCNTACNLNDPVTGLPDPDRFCEQSPIGYVVYPNSPSVTCSTVTGWSCDLNKNNKAIQVDMWDYTLSNPRYIGAASASIDLFDGPELQAICGHPGVKINHGYRWIIPNYYPSPNQTTLFKDGQLHKVRAYGINIDSNGNNLPSGHGQLKAIPADPYNQIYINGCTITPPVTVTITPPVTVTITPPVTVTITPPPPPNTSFLETQGDVHSNEL